MPVTLEAKPSTLNRAQIPAEYRWDFTPIYRDWAAWEQAMKELEGRIAAFAALKGTLDRGPAQLLAAYVSFDELGQLQDRTYSYTSLQRDTDTRDQAVAARAQRVSALYARYRTATAWFTPELLRIPEATVRGWLDSTPALAPYRFPILEAYRSQAHVLDEAGERLMSLSGRATTAAGRIYEELSTSDIRFPTVRLSDGRDVVMTPSNYEALVETAPQQSDRATGAKAHLGTFGATAHTYGAIYNGVLQHDWFVAQARHYGSTLEAALDDDAVPVAVVESLIEATRAGAATFQRYARLRKKLLGLAEYHPYDGFVPLFSSERTMPYTEARDLVLASVAPLGEDYVSKFRRFVTGGRIDVYENEGKHSGAYSAGVYGVGPYLLMNYNDTLDAAFTLAHEAGHAMHTVLAEETQPYVTSHYSLMVAEVASTTNERFLLDELLKRTTDPKERFLLLQHAVDSIVGTFYSQVLFADFELRAHRLVEHDEPVTTETLAKLYLEVYKAYWGDAVTLDDFYQYTWARIPHFFGSPYYVYQYATCFASSAQIYRAMTTGTPESRRAATERYLHLLKSGGSDHPMTLLKQAGADLTQRATIQAVIDQMGELVTQMEREAERIR
jgi:oligoendopeptidase F